MNLKKIFFLSPSALARRHFPNSHEYALSRALFLPNISQKIAIFFPFFLLVSLFSPELLYYTPSFYPRSQDNCPAQLSNHTCTPSSSTKLPYDPDKKHETGKRNSRKRLVISNSGKVRQHPYR